MKLLDFFAQGVSVILVFDFMPWTLSDVITESPELLDEPTIKSYTQMLLRGVADIHALNIMHRVFIFDIIFKLFFSLKSLIFNFESQDRFVLLRLRFDGETSTIFPPVTHFNCKKTSLSKFISNLTYHFIFD